MADDPTLHPEAAAQRIISELERRPRPGSAGRRADFHEDIALLYRTASEKNLPSSAFIAALVGKTRTQCRDFVRQARKHGFIPSEGRGKQTGRGRGCCPTCGAPPSRWRKDPDG